MPNPDEPPVVLVTGASSGIGRAVALEWAARGAALVLCARSTDALEQVRARCEDLGGRALVARTDVTDGDQVDAAVQRARTTFGSLDIAVSVAGVTSYGRHVETSADAFEQVIAVNLLGPANLARSTLPGFRAENHGTLVVVGSLLGRVAVPGMGAYVASKWGLRGLVRVLQQENRDRPGVRITSVAPGSVRTAIYDRAGSAAGDGGRAPAPSTSPRRVARQVVAAASSRPREHDVDALGGLINKVISTGYRTAPAAFDLVVGPLWGLSSTSRKDDGRAEPTQQG